MIFNNNLYNMYITLFDRTDRLGSNLCTYIAQILLAHKNNYIIRYYKNKSDYTCNTSIYVIILFNYIDRHNEKLYKLNILDDVELMFPCKYDFLNVLTIALTDIKTDFITYIINNIYNDIKTDFKNLTNNFIVPFDVNKTILVHLRLGDVISIKDFNGLESSEFYKNKILNNEDCYENHRHECQSIFSKEKIETIINKAKEEFKDYKVILITEPGSDTSFLNYEVIKNNNIDLDLYLMTMCKVIILSRSTYSLSSLFYNDNKQKIYAPLWSNFVCCGFDTIYDKINKSKIEYFY